VAASLCVPLSIRPPAWPAYTNLGSQKFTTTTDINCINITASPLVTSLENSSPLFMPSVHVANLMTPTKYVLSQLDCLLLV
jgi:hypothetical protein